MNEPRRSRSWHGWLLAALLSVLPGADCAAAAETVLRNGRWAVVIHPTTLQVQSRHGDKEPPLSAGQPGLGPVASLVSSPTRATWELPAQHLTVSMQLRDETLDVRFRASRAGTFTWPIVESSADVSGFILPLHEGAYVPTGDRRWISFLVDQGPITTTQGLGMPFWGLDCGDRTLTYILTNPFNNELAFQEAKGRLALQLTHQFTRNQSVKEYGFLIRLSPSSPIEPARAYRRWLQQQGQFVSLREKIRRVPEARKLLGAAHVYLWGDGVSLRMMEQLSRSGLDRLWLGVDGWEKLRRQPDAVRRARKLGYMIGPYDSYHSIHAPDEPDTWETAQFDQSLYETGPVIRADGSKRPGFQKKGFSLSPLAARPYVEKRVSSRMRELPCNSWFIDCDADGELFDDYSPLHPATQQDDMKARLKRMAWIRDTYGAVIGSETGAAYAASAIHFAHGMMTPVFGWGDPDLRNRESPYFQGAYYPPEAPAVFMKQAPLKEKYRYLYFDPRFRLPLYQTVFHDSVVTTHHWSRGSLKFRDQVATVALFEQLYNVPPLYHLNLPELEKHQKRIKAHHAFFSPLHREAGLLPLTGFRWLTPDRQVQQTVFGDRIEITANFGDTPFGGQGKPIPGRSIRARWRTENRTMTFTPMAE